MDDYEKCFIRRRITCPYCEQVYIRKKKLTELGNILTCNYCHKDFEVEKIAKQIYKTKEIKEKKYE